MTRCQIASENICPTLMIQSVAKWLGNRRMAGIQRSRFREVRSCWLIGRANFFAGGEHGLLGDLWMKLSGSWKTKCETTEVSRHSG